MKLAIAAFFVFSSLLGCLATDPLQQELRKPWPSEIYISSEETSILCIDDYIQGNSLSISTSPAIQGVSAVSRLMMAQSSHETPKKLRSSNVIAAKQVLDKTGKPTNQEVILFQNNTLAFKGNQTHELNLGFISKEGLTCYDLAVSPDMITFIDCSAKTSESVYEFLLLTVLLDNLKPVLASVDSYPSSFSPSKELPLILAGDFLFFYTKDSQATGFIFVYLLTNPRLPQLYSVLDQSLFSSKPDGFFLIRDLAFIIEKGSLSIIVNLEDGIYSFSPILSSGISATSLQVPTAPVADSIAASQYENHLVLAYVIKETDPMDPAHSHLALEIFDTETKAILRTIELPGIASEVSSVDISAGIILVGFSQEGEVISGFLVLSFEDSSVIGQWTSSAEDQCSFGNLYLSPLRNEVFLECSEGQSLQWTILNENQVIFDQMALTGINGQLISIEVQTSFGSSSNTETYNTTIHVLDKETGYTSVPEELIPGNGLLISSSGLATFEIPLEDFSGNFFSFNSNASNFSMTDFVEVGGNLEIDKLLESPKGLSLNQLIGISDENGIMTVYGCDIDSSTGLACNATLLSGISGEIELTSVIGEYLAVFDSENESSYFFYNLDQSKRSWSLSGASNCVSLRLFGSSMVACISTNSSAVEIFYDAPEHPLEGENPSPVFSISSGDIEPTTSFAPTMIVPGTPDGILVTDNGQETPSLLITDLQWIGSLKTAFKLGEIQNLEFDECLADGYALYCVSGDTLEVLDFNGKVGSPQSNSFMLPSDFAKGTKIQSGLGFLYVSTGSGIAKIHKNAISSLNAGVSLLNEAQNEGFSVLTIDNQEFIMVDRSRSLLKSNDFYTLQFSYELPSTSILNISTRYFYIESIAQGNPEHFEYYFKIDFYNSTIQTNKTKIDGNILEINANSTRFNLSNIFEGACLYYELNTSNSSDKGKLINITNTLNNLSVFLNDTTNPEKNTIHSFTSFGSLVVGLAQTRLFLWDPETLASKGSFKFIFDFLLSTKEAFTCLSASQMDEFILVAHCQTSEESIFAFVSMMTAKPLLLEQIHTGKLYSEVVVTQSNIYALQIDNQAESLSNKEFINVFSVDLTGEQENMVELLGEISANSFGLNKFGVMDIEVLQVESTELILLLEEKTGIRVLNSSQKALPEQVIVLNIFNESSPDFIFTNFSAESVPVELICSEYSSTVFRCLLTFQTENCFVFNIDFSHGISSPRLTLQSILKPYGTLAPVKGQGSFDSNLATLVVKNSENQTMIVYNITATDSALFSASKSSQNVTTQSIIGGDIVKGHGSALTVAFPDQASFTYVSSSEGLAVYTHSEMAFIDFGNSSEISSTSITIYVVNENGRSNYTFIITDSDKPTTGSWIISGVLFLSIAVVVFVGYILELIFARDKGQSRKTDLKDPFNPESEETEGAGTYPDPEKTESAMIVTDFEETSKDKNKELSLQNEKGSDPERQERTSSCYKKHKDTNYSGRFGRGSDVNP